MSIDREESLFWTVSEDHRKREYPEYIRLMSDPYEKAGGMIAVYEGVILGGGDKLFGLEELNLWLRRYRYAAFDMHALLPIAHMCLEYAVRLRIREERPGIQTMAQQAARELLETRARETPDEANGWGILDHGVGSLEKVHVVNGRTVDVDMGQETAYVYMPGKRYRLRGDVLTEED